MDGYLLADRCYSIQTETRLRSDLASLIRLVIKSMTFRQIDVGSRVARYAPGAGASQADVSRVVRGDLDGYSASRLMVILAALSSNVSIFAQPAGRRGRISVLVTSSALRISA
jgi:predicted XRE-type DNA-binding protein